MIAQVESRLLVALVTTVLHKIWAVKDAQPVITARQEPVLQPSAQEDSMLLEVILSVLIVRMNTTPRKGLNTVHQCLQVSESMIITMVLQSVLTRHILSGVKPLATHVKMATCAQKVLNSSLKSYHVHVATIAHLVYNTHVQPANSASRNAVSVKMMLARSVHLATTVKKELHTSNWRRVLLVPTVQTVFTLIAQREPLVMLSTV